MAATAQDTLASIERRREQLQESVDKLRKALNHWTTWEAEYQALKEGLADAVDASPAQIREIAEGLGSTLLDAKEVEQLLGKDLKTKRTANQVVDVISRRIDYVQQNSATVEKQLYAAEKQLAGVDVLLDPGLENEEGLPMVDIEEELDEEGNEVASSVNQTGKGAAEVVEMLRKAGIRKAELEKQKQDAGADEAALPEPQPTPAKPRTATTTTTKTSPQIDMPPTHEEKVSQPARKTVAFAGDDDRQPEKLTSLEKLEKYGYSEELAITDVPRIVELDDDKDTKMVEPIIPDDESPEDAELRRQMIQYGLSEVGNIVAELNLETPTVEYTDDEDDDDYEYGTEDEEDEDEYGRSLRPVLTDDYRKQMMELEKKLNARMMENVGPNASESTLAEHADDIRTLRVREDEKFDESLGTSKAEPEAAKSTPSTVKAEAVATKSNLSTAKSEPATRETTRKKGVRFADELDVSDAPKPVREAPVVSQPTSKPTPTIANTIVERPASQPVAITAPSKPAKVSRFKSNRATANQPPQMLPTPPMPQAPAVPTGPSGRTLATTVVEHDPSSIDPKEPDEFDPITINREVQTEYHKARNRFIQQQGGFKPTQEDIESPLLEERNGKTQKVSRFMASRLNASGM